MKRRQIIHCTEQEVCSVQISGTDCGFNCWNFNFPLLKYLTGLNYRAEAAKLLWLYPAACYPQCTVTHPDSSVVLLYLMCCCVWCVVVIINYISLSVKSEQTASAAAGECLKSFRCSSAALIRTRQDTDTSPLTQGIHTQLLSAY